MSGKTFIENRGCDITWDHGWHVWAGVVDVDSGRIDFDTKFQCPGSHGVES